MTASSGYGPDGEQLDDRVFKQVVVHATFALHIGFPDDAKCSEHESMVRESAGPMNMPVHFTHQSSIAHATASSAL